MSFEGYSAEQIRAWADHECNRECEEPHETRTNLARYAVTSLQLNAEQAAASDETNEAIHAAHAKTKDILPNYMPLNGYPVEAVHALGEEIDALRGVVEALILFYDSPHWTPEKAARWEELTGSTEATTKVLADSARVALGMTEDRS